jgi:antitoxin Phd
MTIVVTEASMAEAQLRDVKAGFSAVVERAVGGEPTVVTRRGEPVAVVVGYAEWQRLQPGKRDLVDHLLAFPGGLDIPRDPSPPREIDG